MEGDGSTAVFLTACAIGLTGKSGGHGFSLRPPRSLRFFAFETQRNAENAEKNKTSMRDAKVSQIVIVLGALPLPALGAPLHHAAVRQRHLVGWSWTTKGPHENPDQR